MSIRILAVGKRHEAWVADGIDRYEKRLRKPFDASWQLLPHSSREGDAARAEESERILAKVDRDAFLVLLDERGRNVDSPALASALRGAFDSGRTVTVVIGGAYGVSDRVRERADFVWSLSKLVFPHQLVRLILAEQLYRAQEISAGRPYHHV
ncbi:23S rRNA (pseudouridine(1915)-N(3))-methyltransferase RlmH [Leucobacter muris]|uniref:23S rRNA (pseudouridine(1915)-N(3))-methyltransferase RlmH n=1 Tax=Leucobacter muris TaxID=1935379 RepID=UPI0018869A39|nr:23S rRNA (pseudouridine(1915)-N(3))-methyltransferase RlmH [Leucobacter muris]